MRILFDVSTLNPDKVTGVGVYMQQLLRHLPVQNSQIDLVPVVKVSRFKKLKALQRFIGKTCRLLFPWSLPQSEVAYHNPDFKLNTRGLKSLVTVHDMVVFEQKYNAPEFYKKGIKDLTAVLENPSVVGVIVNSHFTKTQVLKFFPKLEGKVHVTHLGCDRGSAQNGAVTVNLPQRYILFLGTLEKRKNVLGVIKAFELLKVQDPQIKLVLAGAWGFESEKIKEAIVLSSFAADIVHLNYVSNVQMIELYQRAQVFFFPSWYEGFGIPALEAMALGCPVIVSRGGALEEVCGSAALTVDPANPQEMAEALKKVLSDPQLQQSLREQGILWSQRFTWQKCAEETLKVYQKVLG